MMLTASSGGRLHLFGSDLAVLEAREERQDLPCAVTFNRPVLGFDLKYHVTYEVAVPMAELEGSESLLTVLFRVVGSEAAEPVYFTHKIRVPQINEGAKGEAIITGSFDIGEGAYKVGWLMRDRSERVCANFFDVEAKRADRDRDMKLDLDPGAITASEPEQFREEPPVVRSTGEPLSVKVLVNFAPQNSRASSLQPMDTQALVSILRGISRDPRVGRFSVVAFNLNDQKVLYKSEAADRIDFPAIGKSLEGLKLGTVSLAKLAEKNSETAFLTTLIRSELAGSDAVDAVVFAGPKAMLEANVPQEALKDVGEISCPVFYLNYNLHPTEIPWRDSIGAAVKFWRGAEYTISRPRDLWFSVSEMFNRVVKSKRVRSATASMNGSGGE
jgi:hypothetical protein